jgi:hypothetical protein
MTIDVDFLYERLPAVYRIRDAQSGEPLKALLAVIAEQAAVIEADIDRLYRNWFIETCEEWVVPYIGELLGVRGLRAIPGTPAYSARALVADTLRMRRRKGTALVLEQLTQDCTGWPAHAVEFFQLLATTQNVNHVRLFNQRTPDLRDSARLERLNGAFDEIAHTGAVRNLPAGRYNIPNIGLFVWRLQDYPLRNGTARAVDGAAPGLYRFDALGRDLPLFNRPRTETDIAHLAEEINVPAPLRRRPLYDELQQRRAAIAAGRPPSLYLYFDDRPQPLAQSSPVLTVTVDGALIPPERLFICSLIDIAGSAPLDWPRPADAVLMQVAVDPELGRLSLPVGRTATRIDVGYAYGFPGDVGGGPYDRRGLNTQDAAALQTRKTFPDALWWQLPTGAPDLSPQAQVFATLADAVTALEGLSPGSKVLLEIVDDASYPAGFALDIPGIDLVLQAADQHRPALLGDLTIRGDAATRVTLNGLALDGKLTLHGPLAQARLAHCTLHRARGGLLCQNLGDDCNVEMRRTLCGTVNVSGALAKLMVAESLLDAGGQGPAIDAPLVDVDIGRCSVIGVTNTQTLSASDSIFTDVVTVARRQQGCIRFSYLPAGSLTPRRFRCQPDLATADLTGAALPAERARLTPVFTSEDFASPAYGQLGAQCAEELLTGADNGAEMGVWNFLQQPQRAANLRNALDEYLRFGLEAALIRVT